MSLLHLERSVDSAGREDQAGNSTTATASSQRDNNNATLDSPTATNNCIPKHQLHQLPPQRPPPPPPPPTPAHNNNNCSFRSNQSSTTTTTNKNNYNYKHSQSMKPYGRPVPCEGCREWRRKCTLGTPCQRCSDRGIECIYLPPGSTPSLAFNTSRRTTLNSAAPPSQQLPRPSWNPMSIGNIVHGEHDLEQLHPIPHPFPLKSSPSTLVPYQTAISFSATAPSAEPTTRITTASLNATTPSTTLQQQPFTSSSTILSRIEKSVSSFSGTRKPRAAVRAVSCKSCHLRKIKCDKGKPSCSHCVDRNLFCEYYL